jgi:CRISPR/Cas system-associated endonuclease Cas1
MSKENEDEVWLTAEPWKPSTVLRAAEEQALKTAKFLHARKDQLARLSRTASVDDAIALAETILALARLGQKQPAAQAFQIMANVETFLDQLAVEMDSLLTETK